MVIKCVITTLDNLDILKQQLNILDNDSLIDKIIVVNNGSRDNTKAFLESQKSLLLNKLVIINRENNGAGPGRNSGLDAAGKFDYVLMLDGGIRPLRDGTRRMFDYLESTPEADVIGVEIPHFETNPDKAWHRWPEPITKTYQNTRLSHTAYCLARYKAFDGLRFSEEGPFGEPGWGADDDEMAYQWNEAGIVVHVVTNVHPFRHGSGSFRRLFQETGIWPNQYGSVYEKRVVWLQQNWAKYQPATQWGEPEPERVITIEANGLEPTIKKIKSTHDKMRQDRFDEPWEDVWKPYHIIVKCNENNEEFLKWAELRRLRQHHGNRYIDNGQIIRRSSDNEELWTGDFILQLGD